MRKTLWAIDRLYARRVADMTRHHLRDLAPRRPGGDVGLRYVGRPERASAAEGYPAAHLLEQQRLVQEALLMGDARDVRSGGTM